ncbi:hypothetical protein ACHAXA_003600 [Cyclostephanos tholiformis]|uniref:Uncharacterized protein n=1 Tax=Cyclostephanos tholiformis TaxID=382380 RepID=A0ABD3SPK4_9STRA
MLTPPPSSNNDNSEAVIIFDWDDTILPSSFVDRSQCDNLGELSSHTRALFREIEICTEKCLAAAACHGEVIIITNSDEGWVKYSAERYLPNLIPVLRRYRIISARTRYEKFYPNQPLCWKAAAFAHEVNEHFRTLEESRRLLERECGHRASSSSSTAPGCEESVQDLDMASTDVSSLDDSYLDEGEGSICSSSSSTARHDGGGGGGSPPPSSSSSCPTPPILPRREIVSIGDSIEERTAVRIVSDQLDATPKSVKFLNNPTPAQIIGQLTMMTHHMTYVCEHETDLDLEISQGQADKCASGYLARRRGGAVDDGNDAAARSYSSSSSSVLRRILRTNNGDRPLADDDDDVVM